MEKDQSVKEINAVIEQIQKALQPNQEIGAQDKAKLVTLLKANGIEKKPKFFKCRREHSAKIITYFSKEKGLTKNRFSANNQEFIYLL